MLIILNIFKAKFMAQKVVRLFKFETVFRLAVFCFAIFGIYIFCFVGHASATTNLLTNGSFSTGDSTGWTVIDNGGSGATFGGNTYATSYTWCSISQTVDLLAAGYTEGQLDAAPDFIFDVTTWQRFDHDGQYYLEYKLLESDGSTVATSSLYGSVGSPIYLAADTAAFTTEYTFSNYGSGVRYAYIKIAGQDGTPNWGGQYGPYFTAASIAAVATSSDYLAEYWDTSNATSPSMPGTTADATTTVSAINFDWGTGAPVGAGDGFIARYTKTEMFDEGIYYFEVTSDDGNRVYLDGNMILDDWVDQSAVTDSTTENISVGSHDIKVEYYENDGNASLVFSYTRTDPQVIYFSPTDNSTGIDADATFEIAFDEAIATSTGNIVLYKASDDSTVETIDITDTSGKITASSTNAIIIDPSTTLDSNTEYYFIIASTTIDDLSGNNFPGITASSTWSFTTADTADPIVSYLSPADDSTGVGVNETFEIAFDEAITTNSGNVILYKTSDDSTVETIDITSGKITASSTNALIIDPSTTLDSETEYYFMIDATAIDDTSGNSYAGITASTTWSFTTADVINPTMSYLSPADNSTGVGVNATFEITFDEVIATSSGNIVLYKASDDSTVETIDITDATGKITASSTNAIIIDPSTTLASETEYYFTIATTAIDDTSGNSYAGITASTTWSFTTTDTEDPIVSYFSPIDNATDIAIDATFEIAFNEAIATSTGNIVFYKASNDSIFETIDITGALVTASSTNALIIDPSTNFSYETEYYIIIAATAIDDLLSNSYAGITASTTWSFTTLDTPDCPTIANAATYNSYPTCGVAICSTGYTLAGGSCVANSSNGTINLAPQTIGMGLADASIPMNETRPVGDIGAGGINTLMYINSNAQFSAVVSRTKVAESHNLKILDLDVGNKKVNITIYSEPIDFDLDLNETKQVDLDKDGINDIEVTFVDLVVNRAEITIRELGLDNKVEEENENKTESPSSSIQITNQSLYNRLKGKIILKVEENGEAYYVSPTKQEMYYLGRPDDAFRIMREQGIGITDENISKFQASDKEYNISKIDLIFTNKHLGKIFLQVEQNGEAHYIYPNNGMRYYLGRPKDAFNIMRNLGLGISNNDFNNL